MSSRAHIIMHEKDNLATALVDLPAGQKVDVGDRVVVLRDPIPAKHKFLLTRLPEGEAMTMYGIVVAKAVRSMQEGELITVDNALHDIQSYSVRDTARTWKPPNIEKYVSSTFDGYHRADHRVGTMNYWLVIPLVFCENRNVEVLRNSMERALGYGLIDQSFDVSTLIEMYLDGASQEDILESPLHTVLSSSAVRPFQNVDGIKFLIHEGGCGGIPEDSEALCRLLASYIANSNVGGATVLSLGCQHAQSGILKKHLSIALPNMDKPVHFCEQQSSESEREFLSKAIKLTFTGLMEINEIERKPASLEHLVLGLECGGSDGFSGISANPVLGHCADMLVALGGTAILGEFPELNGVEQDLIDRCVDTMTAERFVGLMRNYDKRAQAQGSGFKDNPSPGNRADGLITDAIKSAGAARKGGTSPVVDVLDYGEIARKKGLNLCCTPGNDVESTTGLTGAGANVIVFTTGLGTPTGNPIAPTIKMSTNSSLARRMADLIDIDAGPVIEGKCTINEKANELLELIIEVASGRIIPHAVRLGQDDFIPWKRGISL